MSGVAILRAIQSIHSPSLDLLFYAITQLHNETFYILILPLLLWLYDKRFARYMVSVFLLGYWANNMLKFAFHTARPSPNDVRVIHPETGGGPAFPSGHSQNPLMFWWALALHFNRAWFKWLAGIIILLIGLSRLYMGLHWPLDVLGGWAIGALMLWGFQVTMGFWTGQGMSLRQKLCWAVAIPVAGVLLAPLAIPSPLPKDVWVMGGAYMGFWVGSVLEEHYVGFNPRRGSVVAQVMKVIVGVVLIMAVKEGFKLILPANGIGDFIRYSLVALMATLGAPWLFHRMLGNPPVGKPNAAWERVPIQ
ncbi:MAG: phosphatase PAP2 family protein [Mycobacterium leprae]